MFRRYFLSLCEAFHASEDLLSNTSYWLRQPQVLLVSSQGLQLPLQDRRFSSLWRLLEDLLYVTVFLGRRGQRAVPALLANCV